MRLEEHETITERLQSHSKYLFALYRYLQLKSSDFPFCSLEDIKVMLQKFGLLKPELLGDSDLLLLAKETLLNAEKKIKGDLRNPSSCIFEKQHFFELMLRIAIFVAKPYDEKDEVRPTPSQHLNELVNDYLIPCFSDSSAYFDQNFVDHEASDGRVNDVMFVNLDNLKMIYKKHCNKDTFNESSAVSLLLKYMPSQAMKIRNCFRKSRMNLFDPTKVN